MISHCIAIKSSVDPMPAFVSFLSSLPTRSFAEVAYNMHKRHITSRARARARAISSRKFIYIISLPNRFRKIFAAGRKSKIIIQEGITLLSYASNETSRSLLRRELALHA